MVENEEIAIESKLEENNDIIKNWEPLKFNIDEKYEYVPKGFLFSFFSNILYYGIAYPILTIILKIIYDFKIEGKENIKALTTGAISVSNHVLFLDCAMVGIALNNKKVYYTTREESFKIPFVRRLIKLLRAIPIPKGIKNKEYFNKAIEELLQNKSVVHFYPEAALWPYHNKIRNFKYGAFSYAVKNDVPIIPIVISFKSPKGIRKAFKKKQDVTLKILKPIKIDENLEHRVKVSKLRDTVYEKMSKEI